MKTPITDKAFQDAHDQNLPEFGEGWQGFTEDTKSAMRELEEIATDALKSFRCTQRPSDYPETHWSRRLENLLENDEVSHGVSRCDH